MDAERANESAPGTSSANTLAADEALARRLQAEEESLHMAHSHLLAADEALARALQGGETSGGGEGEQRKVLEDVGGASRERVLSHHKRELRESDEASAGALRERNGGVEPEKKKQRREESEGTPQESGCQGSAGPGSFQLLNVHALPPWANKGCCKISDIVQGDIQWCILTNYMIDLEWLLSACPVLHQVPRVVLIHGEGGGALERLETSKPANVALHKPPLPISYGTHHSKAMLLVYPHGVRVVVHTANLIYIDWNNKTQGLWYQDFPLKSPESPNSSPFEDDLLDYLEALRWPGVSVPSSNNEETRVTSSFFRRFDYSRAAVRLVASVPGYHRGRWLMRWGHMKMRAVLEKEAFAEDFRGAPLVYQFSSLGSLDERWMAEFRASLTQGRTSIGRPLGPGEVRIVWPTVEDVRQSIEGYGAGGAIPGPEKNVFRPWLRQYWSKFQADHCGRSRVMPHIKTFVRYRNQDVAWFLLTSANLSKAAWGSLQKNDTQLMIRSYELGVLFLPSLVAKHGLGPQFSCTEPNGVGAGCNSEGGRRLGSQALSTNATSLQIRDLERADEKGQRADDKEASTSFLRKGKGHENEETVGEATEEPRSVRFVTTAPQSNAMHDSEPTESTGDASTVVRLPLPYALPPAKYGTRDRPWSVDCQYTQPDVYGETWPRTVVKYGVKQSEEDA